MADSKLKVDGLKDGMSCPRNPTDESLGSVPITRHGYDVSPDDPMHDYSHIDVQINQGQMNGFVADALSANHNESNPVSMFDKTSAPIINQLALEYAVFDRWFCSIPGPTDPNRAFAMSGSSMGELHNFNGTLWSQQSYFDYLRVNNRSFAGYYQDDPWALYYFQDTNRPENSQFIHDLDTKFYDDCSNGNLADFVWLQPRMTSGTDKNLLPSWQHPDASVLEGERLIKHVYEALRSSPVWNETLFLITYDEHGGFYDHVNPPSGVPAPDEHVASNNFAFDRLGVRIPTIAISPWINAGTVVSEPRKSDKPFPNSAYDSTSILATANKLLGVDAEPLGQRMAWAATFDSILSHRKNPRTDCPETLVPLPILSAAEHAQEVAIQRAKPLNHHLEAQIIFYCHANTATVEERNQCLSHTTSTLTNQGLASDWILAQVSIHQAKLRAAESTWRVKKL